MTEKQATPKKATTSDVAKLSGVSQSTVSFVLNNKEGVSISEETRQRVLDAVKSLGYQHRAAANQRQKRAVIGYVFPTYVNMFHFMTAQMIDSEAARRGYRMVLCNTGRDKRYEAEQVEWLIKQKVDGIIYSFNPLELERIEEYNRQLPIVILGEKNYDININTISLNSFKSGEIIAEHLIELGHKNFAFMTTPLTSRAISRKQRFEGVLSTLRAHGLADNLLVCQSQQETESLSNCGDEVGIGYRLTCEMLQEHHNITAIIGLNDMFAIGVIKALVDAKIKIPQDISVCGFDNLFLSNYISPSITTVDHFLQHRCRAALDLVIDRVAAGNEDVVKIEYDPKLVLGNSTGPVRAERFI